MKKTLMKLSAVLLAVCLLLPVSFVYTGGNTGTVNAPDEALAPAEDEGTQTAEAPAPVVKENFFKPSGDGYVQYPTIVVPGIMQSEVVMLDENGNRKVDKNGRYILSGPDADANGIFWSLIGPLFNALVFKKMDDLYKAIDEIVLLVTKNMRNDKNGQPIEAREVIKYPNSFAESTPEEQRQILNTIPLHDYVENAGGESLYFFTYDSFGNQLDIAADLYEFIQKVKSDRNTDKVNLCPISLGATVMNSLMDVYPDVKDSINKVIYIVPAANGSKLAAGLFRAEFNRNGEDIYKNLLPSLVDGFAGFALNLVVRILPKNTLLGILDAVLRSVRDNFLTTCTNLWALVPNEDYMEFRNALLMSDDMAVIREQTDRYYQAQANRFDNIMSFIDSGVRFYCLVDYGVPTYNFIPNWDDHNSDGLVHLESASFGAYAAPIGKTLPEGYVQKNTSPYISNPNHNYISPDNVVDASAGLLADTTWYFRNQNHEATARNDVIINLASTIMSSDRIENIFSDPKYPQFLVGRNARSLKYDLLKKALEVDTSELTDEQKAALQAAIDEVQAVLDNPLADQNEISRVSAKLVNVLADIGLVGRPKEERKEDKLLYYFFKVLSDITYKMVGEKGYADLKA